jgi:hypothetical protein
MHALHDYVAKQLAERLKFTKVVVWYDARSEFATFVREVRGGVGAGSDPLAVSVAGIATHLAEYTGSLFELRARVEPHVKGDAPGFVIVYLPGCERDRRASALMELEKAGECYEPQLKRLARNVLRQRYTDGVIDEILAPEHVSYEDLVHALASDQTGGAPSILKAIYHHHSSSESLLADWFADDSHDGEIGSKEARPELEKLILGRLGLKSPRDASLAKLRAVTLRYLLANEFRSDLQCPAPPVLESISQPASADESGFIHKVAGQLRLAYPDSYVRAADQVEADLKLASQSIDPAHLGSIDTFRFEERALLRYCGDLIANAQFAAAVDVVTHREDSFWILREFTSRKAQWEACRRMAELGLIIQRVGIELNSPPGAVDQWVNAYAAIDGWHLVDRAQRKLESWVAGLDDEPDEKALGIVRRAYEDLCSRMASQFAAALNKADWVVSGVLHQTRVHAEILSQKPTPVAYLMVDALRFEMGADLADRLPRAAELRVTPALAAIPGITPVGMAALLPGASSDFAVVEQQGKLGARIDGAFLPDLVSRRKFFAGRAAGMVDLSLDELLSLQPSKLAKKLGDAPIVVVRSQEIDHAGETGFTFQARQIMDTVIDNLGRAIRKLASAGIEHFVVSADHGHLFFPTDRDESLRTDAPSTNAPLLHRRCWGGRGGATPPGCARVPASKLGYDSDLEFTFPPGIGVFKTGGDLAYYHGGLSLQELVIPVLSIRLKVRESARPKQGPVNVSNVPDTITNRIFSVVLELGGAKLSLFEGAMQVRPVLIASGRQVGAAGMAVGADLDSSTGCVKLLQAKPATVALRLTEEVSSVRFVVLDPATDAELYRSPADIPVRLAM